MPNRVRNCLLRDAERRELDLWRRTLHAFVLDRYRNAGHPSRAIGKPVKRWTHAEIIEQRQP